MSARTIIDGIYAASHLRRIKRFVEEFGDVLTDDELAGLQEGGDEAFLCAEDGADARDRITRRRRAQRHRHLGITRKSLTGNHSRTPSRAELMQVVVNGLLAIAPADKPYHEVVELAEWLHGRRVDALLAGRR